MDKFQYFYDLARDKLDEQFRLFSAYDTRSAILIATNGLVIAMLPQLWGKIDFFSFRFWILVIAVILIFSGLVCVILVLQDNEFKGLPEVAKVVERYGSYETESLVSVLCTHVAKVEANNLIVLERKDYYFKVSAILLGLGLFVIIGVLVWGAAK